MRSIWPPVFAWHRRLTLRTQLQTTFTTSLAASVAGLKDAALRGPFGSPYPFSLTNLFVGLAGLERGVSFTRSVEPGRHGSKVGNEAVYLSCDIPCLVGGPYRTRAGGATSP